MEKPSLDTLPTDLFLDIVDYLDTARDVAHLGQSARQCHHLIGAAGWRTFVKKRFPLVNLPHSEQSRWSSVADRMTYLDRCWAKKGFWMNLISEKRPHGKPQQRRQGGQSVLFHGLVDAQLTPSGEHELLAAGVGENLLIRLTPENNKAPDVWHQIQGKDYDYLPGLGDVTAISVIERHGNSEVVVGRANGDVGVLSSQDDFRRPTQNLLPVATTELEHGSNSTIKSPAQSAISWTEFHPQQNLLASSKGSLLSLYNLSQTEEADISPLMHYDFSRGVARNEASLVRCIKFMDNDTVACSLGGSVEPLRWGKLTPTGIEFFNAVCNPKPLEVTAALTTVRLGEKTTVRAIQPVTGAGSGNLLLSAWDDGTYRLMDMRTPCPQDAVYRDRFQPYEPSSSLLVYGSERFVAGSNTSRDIRLFDFRYPKSYYHTSALPCSDRWPVPPRRHDDAVWNMKWGAACPRGRCDAQRGITCSWHAQSTWDHHRPDSTIHIGNPGYDRIYSLAKASDTSYRMYAGLGGGILEMNLGLTDDAAGPEQGPRAAPPGWRMGRPGGKISLIETGVSLCQTPEWALEDRGVPDLVVQEPNPRKRAVVPEWAKMHRLDYAFHRPHDYEGPAAAK